MDFSSIFGCKFTVFNFLMGSTGSLIAVLVMPGCYTVMPSARKIRGAWHVRWGILGRLFAGGIAGCIADNNGVNALFAGIISWQSFKFVSEEGWKSIKSRLELFIDSLFRTK